MTALLRPDHVGIHAPAVAKVLHIGFHHAATLAAQQPPPLTGSRQLQIGHRRRHRRQRGTVVVVAVNGLQLRVVVSIGVLVAFRTTGVVHAGAEVFVIEVLVLMAQPEIVADLLAHHQLAPGRRIVAGGPEVAVVELGGALHDMAAAGPDLRQPQPAVIAVQRIADLDPAARRPATLGGGATGHHLRIQHRGIGPVCCRRSEELQPAAVDVIAQLHGKRVAGTGPVVIAPGMAGLRQRRRQQGSQQRAGQKRSA